MIVIRLATTKDAKAILDIYGPYIQNTSLTFETEIPAIEAFEERIKKYLENWPWLVCELNGQVVGYAYASQYRERKGYQWSIECSVYIHDDFNKRGIGKALYFSLFEILKKQGYNNVYAVINLPNDNSVAFHESCGFNYFTTYENVGFKLGEWKNVGWWRLIVNDFGVDPAAPTLFSKLDQGFLPALFKSMQKEIKV